MNECCLRRFQDIIIISLKFCCVFSDFYLPNVLAWDLNMWINLLNSGEAQPKGIANLTPKILKFN